MILLSSITNLVSVKLDHSNYMLWKFQICSTLNAYALFDIVDGTYPCPNKYYKDIDGILSLQVNHEYLQWCAKDQVLISMISATLSQLALSLVISQKSAKGVWDSLERRYTSMSRTNVLGLKRDLNNIKKNIDSISVYMQKIKECKDKLEAVGVIMEDEELLHIVLDGLPQNFYHLCSTMRTRSDDVSFEQLLVLLTAEEKSLKLNAKATQEPSLLTMLGTGPRYNNSSSTPIPQFNAHSNRGGRGGRSNNYRGRGGRNFNNNNNRGGSTSPSFNSYSANSSPFNNSIIANSQRPTCQICYKMGHTAIDCYHRMNFTYQGRHPTSKLVAMASSTHNLSSNYWISDTGATDHFTPDLANIQHPTEYTGTDTNIVGNGNTLPITHIGHAQLRASKYLFALRHTLRVPNMKSNLLSVYKCCKDNNYSFILMLLSSQFRTYLRGKSFTRASMK